MNEREHLITCLCEEGIEVALELAKNASKTLRFGEQDRNVKFPDGPTNAERLVDELNDMVAIACMLADAGVIPNDWYDPSKQDGKRQRVLHFMQYARGTGALDKPPGCKCNPKDWRDYKVLPVCDQFELEASVGLCAKCSHLEECHQQPASPAATSPTLPTEPPRPFLTAKGMRTAVRGLNQFLREPTGSAFEEDLPARQRA